MMKNVKYALTLKTTLQVVMLLSVFAFATSAYADCTVVNTTTKGQLTAAKVANTGETISGEVNAYGCDIGVYIPASATGVTVTAAVHDANQYGVYNNGGNATVSGKVKFIGNHIDGTFVANGVQTGVGVRFDNGATGSITNSSVSYYQKGGIVVTGVGTEASVSGNIVTGLGPVDFIAQNGIQFSFGATGEVKNNAVSENAYTGLNNASSGGILVAGGPGYGGAFSRDIQINRNTLIGNDVGIYISQYEAGFSGPPSLPTNIKVVNNTISNCAFTNKCHYQAGISDVGNNDKLINNTITGDGYDPDSHPGQAYWIDTGVDFTNKPKVHAND
jgi:hypothetical protein